MTLPYTSNSLLFWMDCAEKFVTRDSSNKIISIVNRVDGNPIVPQTNISQPTWVDNSINGYPALSFTGAQCLSYDLPDFAGCTGAKKPLILMIVAKINTFSPVSTLTMLRNKTNTNPKFYFFAAVSGVNRVLVARYDDLGNNDFTPLTFEADTSTHIYTNAYDSTSLKLRIDGIEKANVTATNGTAPLTANRLFIGSNGDTGFTNAKIAEVILYSGDYGGALDFSPEQYLKDKYGL